MNSDQVKALLIDTAECSTDFSVVLSGKASKVANGIYKPATREIVLHNRNFDDDIQLVYTALHEYAHHLVAERQNFVTTGRPHTNEFWSAFHELLEKAERKGHYRNVFEADPAFGELSSRIKAATGENGKLLLELGNLMVEAEKLCRDRKVRFEDFVDRVLGLPRTTAYASMRASAYSLPAELGWDAMKHASTMKDPEKRALAVEAYRAGKGPEQVKSLVRAQAPETDPAERLEKEKLRLERTIAMLANKLEQVTRELENLGAAP
ncbi:MAG: hypothetical protein JXA15_08575 [Spirochaetales bacterium]|nr:hypothetical protein [Spirochaetales bacterium]